MREAAHEDAVPRQLTHITGTQFPHLSCDAVLFHQRFLRTDEQRWEPALEHDGTIFGCTDFGEVELKRVIGGQGDHEASGQILRQWVAVVAEEQAVVAQR